MTVTDALLVVIAMLLFGLLTAVKSGFNQVIRGLQALDERSLFEMSDSRSSANGPRRS